MKNLRFVILDNAKANLENPDVKLVLSEMIMTKQKNFLRTDPDYISMNSLDMISSHFLIYDCSNMLNPRLVMGIRTCFESRTREHKLKLPIEEYIDYVPEKCRKVYDSFREEVGELVDCNAWFVDPQFTYSNSGLNLSEIAYFLVIVFVLRHGRHNLVGASNERYKASRWTKKMLIYDEDLMFEHPKVKDPHKLILAKDFHYDWLKNCIDQYGEMVLNTWEVVSTMDTNPELLSVEAVFEDIKTKAASGHRLKVA